MIHNLNQPNFLGQDQPGLWKPAANWNFIFVFLDESKHKVQVFVVAIQPTLYLLLASSFCCIQDGLLTTLEVSVDALVGGISHGSSPDATVTQCVVRGVQW